MDNKKKDIIFYTNKSKRCAQTAIKCILGNRNLSWRYLDFITGREKNQITTPVQIAYGLQKINVDFVYPIKDSFLSNEFNLLRERIIRDFGRDNLDLLNFEFVQKARREIIISKNYIENEYIDLELIKQYIKKGRTPICLINYDLYINRENKKRGHYLILSDIKKDFVKVMDSGPCNASPNKIISKKRLENSLMQTPIDFGIIFV